MAAFDPDDAYRQLADFDLLQTGSVHHQATTAEQGQIVDELASSGYTHIALHASRWSSSDDLHAAVSFAFDFPVHYGRNMDALADCLSDVAEGRYGWEAGKATGLMVTIDGFDRFDAAQPDLASALLEVSARCSGYALLFGHRLLWLVAGEASR